MKKIFLKSTVSALLISFLLVFEAQGQTVPLSIDEALAIFYQRNLDLIAAQYNIDQSQADAIIASAIPNPTFGFQLRRT